MAFIEANETIYVGRWESDFKHLKQFQHLRHIKFLLVIFLKEFT